MANSFLELGVSGLKQYSGYVDEEWLRQLRGDRGRRVLRDMADNDAIVGAFLFGVEMLLRSVRWTVEPFDGSPEAQDQAEFLETLMDDMSHTWEDFVAEALTMLPYGWAACELCYKRRVGPDEVDPTRRSKYDDGLVGWRKLPLRSQDTLDRWEFDDAGGLRGLWQLPPSGGDARFLPVEKLLLFRTTSRRNNPEGRSVLRSAYVAWYHRTRVAANEAIGVERDLAGIPLIYAPASLFADDAPADVKAQLAEYKKIVENVRQDEQAGLLLPDIRDDKGNQLLTFQLVGTGSRRQFDTSKIVERYNREILMTVLADFIAMGHERVGSLALSSDKTDIFATALGAWLGALAAPINRHAVPRLYRLNGWDPARAGRYVPGDLEKADVERLAGALEKLTNTGWLTPGAAEDEAHLREELDLPATPPDRDQLRTPPPAAPEPSPTAPQDQPGGPPPAS